MSPHLISLFCLVFVLGTAGGKWGRRAVHPRHCCHNRIVGGVDTDISEVPYQAALLWNDYYFCGAAIISNKFLVTGAHCILFFFQMFDADEALTIRVGSNYSEKGGVTLKAHNTLCHPKFDFDNYDYDICLIQLEKPLVFNKNIKPIKVGDVEPKGGELGKVSGWGTLWEGGSVPERLQSVTVPVTNRTFCKEAYENICPITERMFCAGEEGKDSCQGDSGGGLAVKGLLVGVISTGFGCGVKNFPGVYTSVAHPEIRKYIKQISGV